MSAGIKNDSAVTYAVTFSKNQIQLDMLPEMKKEYLEDMGITLVGHIIAILRHAKRVHTEEKTKSTLSTTKGCQQSTVASKVVAPAAKPISKTTPIVKVQTASKVTKVVSSTHSKRRDTRSAIAPLRKPTPESTVVDKRKDKSIFDTPRASSRFAQARPAESPVKRKLANVEAGTQDKCTSKKRMFQRLGQAAIFKLISDNPAYNGENVFTRLGHETAPSAPMVVVAAEKLPVKPIISSTKLVTTPKQADRLTLIGDLKKKVMMINKGVHIKTMRADQDDPVTSLSTQPIHH